MEKQYVLESREAQQMAQIEQARTQALAQIGALMMDLETAKRSLEVATERHRAFVQSAVSSRGIERFENARVVNGSLVVALPDAPAKVNGDERTIDGVALTQ
jgi:hypothetical protein